MAHQLAPAGYRRLERRAWPWHIQPATPVGRDHTWYQNKGPSRACGSALWNSNGWLLADEERREHEGDRAEELHQHVERRTGGVLEGVADGVADDGGGVGVGAFADDVAALIGHAAGLDEFLCVVPG